MSGSDEHRRQALGYLLGGDVLWGVRYRPESLLLMRRLWQVVDDAGAERLVDAILRGPPPVAAEDAVQRHEHAVALRLRALEQEGGRILPQPARSYLDGLEARGVAPPPLSADGREQFPFWSTTGFVSRSGIVDGDLRRMRSSELLEALGEPGDPGESRRDAWRGIVAERPGRGVALLMKAAAKSRWDPLIWRDTLMGLEQSSARANAFRRVAPLLIGAPDAFLAEREVGWAIGFWLPDIARRLPQRLEFLFWRTWDRVASVVFETAMPDQPRDDPFSAAINEGSGRLTEALMWRWSSHKPVVGGGIPAEVEPRMRWITGANGYGPRLGRVILARQLGALFANDPAWTREHLLPRFAWSDHDEAAAMWRGFLSGGAIDPSLFAALERDFWDTLRQHSEDVYGSTELLWQMFVIACLEMPGSIDPSMARDALRDAPVDARRNAASQLYRMMPDDEPDKGALLWRNRIAPWLGSAWPKDRQLVDAETTEKLLLAAAASGSAFPEAVQQLDGLLVPGAASHLLVHTIDRSDLAERFPSETARLLETTIGRDAHRWQLAKAASLLDRAEQAMGALADDHRYRRFRERLEAALA